MARSRDLSSALVVLSLLLVLPSVFGNLGSELTKSVQLGCSHVPSSVNPAEIGHYFWMVMQGPAIAMMPMLAVAVVVGLAANFAQVGFVFSAEALAPSFSKLNPFTGVKRLFSATAGVEGLKATLKAILFAYLAWTSIQANWKDLVGLGFGTPSAMFAVIGTILKSMFLKVSMAWLALAAIDYFFQRKQIDKQLRMTKQEVRQEMRDTEQAPELRGARAKRRRALAKGRMMEAVKKADAVVTNPTHYSVALRYEAGKMHAPQVVAKGMDLVAMKIREVASEHKVPVIPNPPLARQLYRKCEIGDFVPRELFQATAEVLAYVYRTMRNHGKR